MPEFVIRFQNLRLQVARPIPEDELKDTLLAALREPLRTTLALFDFKNQSLEKEIDKALAMDRTQSNNTMTMAALHRSLPAVEEELRFRRAVQCTTCLNTEHSTMECSLRTHCMICHSQFT